MRFLDQFLPQDGKGLTYFFLAGLPVVVEGILHCITWRQWAALPFSVLLAGLTATKAYNSPPQQTPK